MVTLTKHKKNGCHNVITRNAVIGEGGWQHGKEVLLHGTLTVNSEMNVPCFSPSWTKNVIHSYTCVHIGVLSANNTRNKYPWWNHKETVHHCHRLHCPTQFVSYISRSAIPRYRRRWETSSNTCQHSTSPFSNCHIHVCNRACDVGWSYVWFVTSDGSVQIVQITKGLAYCLY